MDPPLLYASGEACARLERRSESAAQLAAACAGALFVLVGVSCYRNRRGVSPLWRAFGWPDGRDFMWTFPLRGLRAPRPGSAAGLFATAVFASYPGWLALGYLRGRR